MLQTEDNDLMHEWAETLFPICRSLTGAGVRETLNFIKKHIPELNIHEIASHEAVFDWQVPSEWQINGAYILMPNGEKICDFKQNNLHVMGYSEPVSKKLSLEELKPHLYTQPEQPTWIPYVTSYYSSNWGFCLTQHQFESLPEGEYTVHIDSKKFAGKLNYADLLIEGKSKKEILFSSYVCHPSLANNELSGPVVLIALTKWLLANKANLKYSYRIVLVPETIGSICYLSKHLSHLQQNLIAGFQVSCIGDDRAYSYVASRYGNNLADKVVKNVLVDLANEGKENLKTFSFLERGSDERQYCAPFIDLPVCGVCRTKYGEYPEYHTSADDLSLISKAGLNGGLNFLQKCLIKLEQASFPRINCLGEPQLGKRGLYPNVSQKGQANSVYDMMNVIAYADGINRIEDIAEYAGIDTKTVLAICEKLQHSELISILSEPGEVQPT